MTKILQTPNKITKILQKHIQKIEYVTIDIIKYIKNLIQIY